MTTVLPNLIYCPSCQSRIRLENEETSSDHIVCPNCSNKITQANLFRKYCPNCKATYQLWAESCSDCKTPLEQYIVCPACHSIDGLLKSMDSPCIACAFVPTLERQDPRYLRELMDAKFNSMESKDVEKFGKNELMLGTARNLGYGSSHIDLINTPWFKVLVPQDEVNDIKMKVYGSAFGILLISFILIYLVFGIAPGSAFILIYMAIFFGVRNQLTKKYFSEVFDKHYNNLFSQLSNENS